MRIVETRSEGSPCCKVGRPSPALFTLMCQHSLRIVIPLLLPPPAPLPANRSLLAVKGYLPFLDSSFQDPASPAPASPPPRSTTTATNTSSPTPSPTASTPYDPTTASKRRDLLAGQALQTTWPPPPGPPGIPSPPPPPGPPAPPAPPPGWQYSSGPVQSNPERSETQDTAYTLTVAALLFGVVLVLHALVYLGYRWACVRVWNWGDGWVGVCWCCMRWCNWDTCVCVTGVAEEGLGSRLWERGAKVAFSMPQ